MFNTEHAVYERQLDGWLRQRLEGHFVVIKGDEVLGTESSFESAMRIGVRKTRSLEFFVQRIQSKDTIEWMSHIAPSE